ncbi:MAG: DNA alkylation repair protein [Parcubacteria group bacterium]
MSGIIVRIRKELEGMGCAKIRASEQRFFKEPIKTHGVRSAEVVAIGRKYFREVKKLEKKEIFALCEELFSLGYNDAARIGCDWSYNLRANYQPADFKIFESWIDKYIDNWAKCDTFCNHTVGALVEMYPDYAEKLKILARSKNRWLRRAAAVSLIVPVKRGKFLPEVFAIADILLEDEDDMVQKGYGWLLKVAGEKHQEEVFAYVMRRKTRMPRTALRYAIEKMPSDLKKLAMKK